MHVALAIFMIFALHRWADWKDWQTYHTTMMFFALGNLLYNFLTASHFLWRLDADFLSNHTLTEMLYTFIVFPATAWLFLAHHPKQKKKVVIHYFLWIGVYVGVEWIFTMTKHIDYQYGWNLGWSALFDCIMFPVLRLHQQKPLIAYLLAIPIGVFFIWWFDVPVHIPVEKR